MLPIHKKKATNAVVVRWCLKFILDQASLGIPIDKLLGRICGIIFTYFAGNCANLYASDFSVPLDSLKHFANICLFLGI